jgi:glycerate kinase
MEPYAQMKIVIAMDSFKGTLSSFGAGTIVKKVFAETFPGAEITVIAVADGGEGINDAMLENIGGAYREVTAEGPFGEPVRAKYVLSDDIAVIEMAEVAGLTLLHRNEANPELASTYGVGELIIDALDAGAKEIIIGLGGSATNDGGSGMAQALGASLLNDAGNELPRGGAALSSLAHISLDGLDQRIRACTIVGACDVTNPLCGKNGASFIYGPQKGADAAAVQRLDKALMHFSEIVRADLCLDSAEVKGSGAAGGLGFGLMAFCGAQLRPGIDLVLEHANIDKHLKGASLTITGEGSIDAQTINGKTPVGVARYAVRNNVPVVAICGQARDGYDAVYAEGIDAVFSSVSEITDPESALKHAEKNLKLITANVARAIHVGIKIKDRFNR